jgi:tetratricopeptide (TPR) repeat protein
VYLARDERLDRSVAVKVLHPELASAIGHDRFLREIRIASQLRHPHIIPVLDFGRQDDQLWYAMPLIDGGTLRQRLIRDTQLRVEDALAWCAEIADALAFAHEQGFVHRDVKPENILLDGAHAVLADFGIARGIDPAVAEQLTSAGIAVGTPAYMSPEQATGETVLDGRSDVYSLSCVLYECLAGVAPFVGPTPQSVIAQRFSQAPHPVASYRSTVPHRVREVLGRGLQLVPADRMLAREMSLILREESTGELRLSTGARPGAHSITASGVATKRRRTLIAGGAVATIAALGIGQLLTATPSLDRGKVVVFPLTVQGTGGDASVGVGVPALIGLALDGLQSVRWVEGDNLVSSAPSTDARALHASHLGAARDVRAGYIIDGSVLAGVESTTVVIRLVSVSGDSVVARAGAATATAGDVPALALRAVGQLLPSLLEPGRRFDLSALTDRKPAAIAAFLLGERDYRRSRYVDALGHYEAALAVDSNLAIAALKAARSARSLFRELDARRFVAIALARDSLLPGANAHFARALGWLYQRNGDSSLSELERAVRLAPTWAELHGALGDIHFYLGVDGVSADSAAEDNYRRSRALDSTLTPTLYHLAILAARRRDPAATRAFIAEYKRGDSPDTVFARAMGLAADCQERGVASVDWSAVARTVPYALILMGKVLVGAGADVPCSRAGFTAVFAKDGPPSRDAFAALQGLVAVAQLVADTASIDRLWASPMGTALHADALAVFAGGSIRAPRDRFAQAERAMRRREPSLGKDEIWILGAWYARQGNGVALDSMLAMLRAKVGTAGSTRDSVRVSSLAARAALLSGDTSTAIALLQRENRFGTQQEYAWGFTDPKSTDYLLLAEVLSRRGDMRAANRYAERLEHAHELAHAMFFRDALQIRIAIADGDRNAPLVDRLKGRMAALR